MNNNINEMYNKMGISQKVIDFTFNAKKDINDTFDDINQIYLFNENKVINAFRHNKIDLTHFTSSSGYGYDDIGREKLEKLYSDIFCAEDCIVRPQITCGTHALYIAISANLKAGETLYSPAGNLYDKIQEVIGVKDTTDSLKEQGINYRQTNLLNNETFDFDSIKDVLENDNSIKLITIQRSHGYDIRHSFTIDEIKQLIDFIKSIRSDVNILVDNCYGEFVDYIEPTSVGADLIAGSLIKNPGGGIAGSGGYIAGKKELINKCANRLNGPGLGKAVGANFNVLRDYFLGIFLSPQVVKNALMTSTLASKIYSDLGFDVVPKYNDKKSDIIQTIIFNDENILIEFCKAIQNAACIDSYVDPIPSDMPGYDDKIIMASGAFTQGSSIELSCDGPIRKPYAAFLQGGLTYNHGLFGIMNTIEFLQKKGYIKL